MGMADASQLSISAVSSSLLFFVDSARWREDTFTVSVMFLLHDVVRHLQWPDVYESLITFKIGLKDSEGVRIEVGHGAGGQGDQPLQLWPGDGSCPLTRCTRMGCQYRHWRQLGPERQVDISENIQTKNLERVPMEDPGVHKGVEFQSWLATVERKRRKAAVGEVGG